MNRIERITCASADALIDIAIMGGVAAAEIPVLAHLSKLEMDSGGSRTN